MARNTGASCRLCRREGMKLFLKGSRCETGKCAFVRRPNPPGYTRQRRRRARQSDYGVRLREKQKVKRFYGVLERQFRRYFREAGRQSGNTGDNLLVLLERRLDNVLYRSGLAQSRAQGRVIIAHGHICLNGRRAHAPSQLVSPGDQITLAPRERSQSLVAANRAATQDRQSPSWLALSAEPLEARMLTMPTRDEVELPVQVELIVEFLAR
ncbi:MAG: 30S ribosomal protein S4 [Planctomycetes bacterium]|nr:30S ribosomal protein S4 [Planctomycetota bacterium]